MEAIGHFSPLRDIAVVMTVAGAVAVAFHRLRFPFVLGYLVAGILLSPGVFPSALGRPIHDMQTVRGLVDLGIVFVVFNIGMEFRLYRLKQLGLRVVLCGLIEAAVMMFAGVAAGRALGWSPGAALMLGAVLVPCSTIILSKGLTDARLDGRPFGRMALGLAIVEDLVVIVLLVVLTSLASGGPMDWAAVWGMAWRILVFVALAVAGGLVVVPRLMNGLYRAHHHEALVIVTFGLCFGFALLSLRLGYSGALGAFVIGLIAAESLAREWLVRRLEPMREFFLALFFVSIGVLFDAGLFATHARAIAGVTVMFVVVKAAAVGIAGTVAGFSWKRSLRAGLAMTNLGEFSFILGSAVAAQGFADPALYPMVLGVCVLSAGVSPLLVRRADRIADFVEKAVPGPLRTFLALYESRIMRPWAPKRRSPWWTLLRRPVLLLAGEATVLSAIVIAGPVIRSTVDRLWGGPLAGRITPEWVAWIVVLVLIVPVGVAAWRNIGVLALLLAELAVPRVGAGAGRGLLEKAMGGAVALFLSLLLLGWLVVLSQPFLPPWPVTVLLTVVGGVLAAAFWRQMVQLHQRLESAVQVSLDSATNLSRVERQEARLLLEDRYPMEASIRELMVLPDSQVVGQSLRQLRLREETGATVLSIRRSGFELVNPPAETVMFPEDHLLVVGGVEDLGRARAFIGRTRPRDVLGATEIWTLRLTDYSPAVGRTLADLNLRVEAGVSVVGMIREGSHTLNPEPQTVLGTGDCLVLFGTLAQLSRAGAGLGGELVESEAGVLDRRVGGDSLRP